MKWLDLSEIGFSLKTRKHVSGKDLFVLLTQKDVPENIKDTLENNGFRSFKLGYFIPITWQSADVLAKLPGVAKIEVESHDVRIEVGSKSKENSNEIPHSERSGTDTSGPVRTDSVQAPTGTPAQEASGATDEGQTNGIPAEIAEADNRADGKESGRVEAELPSGGERSKEANTPRTNTMGELDDNSSKTGSVPRNDNSTSERKGSDGVVSKLVQEDIDEQDEAVDQEALTIETTPAYVDILKKIVVPATQNLKDFLNTHENKIADIDNQKDLEKLQEALEEVAAIARTSSLRLDEEFAKIPEIVDAAKRYHRRFTEWSQKRKQSQGEATKIYTMRKSKKKEAALEEHNDKLKKINQTYSEFAVGHSFEHLMDSNNALRTVARNVMDNIKIKVEEIKPITAQIYDELITQKTRAYDFQAKLFNVRNRIEFESFDTSKRKQRRCGK